MLRFCWGRIGGKRHLKNAKKRRILFIQLVPFLSENSQNMSDKKLRKCFFPSEKALKPLSGSVDHRI